MTIPTEPTGSVNSCSVRYETGPCPNPAIDTLPVCGPCLTLILSEADPARRRSLAGLPRIPVELVDRLAHDPDPGVRARVATRNDLTERIVARFVDPKTETSPIVWRALAASRAGGDHAAALTASGDHTTLLILATNPATPADILATLGHRGDEELTATVAALQSGHAPDENVISKVLEARNITSRPLTSPPPGTRWPGPPTGDSPIPKTPRRDGPGPDDPASHRGLVIGFAVAVALVLGAVIVTLSVGNGSSEKTQSVPTTQGAPTTQPTATTTPPTITADPTTSASAPSTTRRSSGKVEPVTLELTMRATNGRFCKSADVTITYDAPLSKAVITDDQNRTLYEGDWPAGSTRTIAMIEPTSTLTARLTTRSDPDTFQPSGSVAGTFC